VATVEDDPHRGPEIVLLTGKDATRNAIRDLLSTDLLGNKAKVLGDHSVLVFFAGHGSRIPAADGSDEQIGAIYPADVRIKDGKADPASVLRLQDDVVYLLQQSAARHKLLLLDSCFSGDVFSRQLPSRSRDDDRRHDQHLFTSPAFQAIASCRIDQTAADGRLGHSPFTTALLAALRTMPTHPDNRHELTVTEPFQFMRAGCLQRMPDDQSPDLRSLTKDDGEFRFFPSGDFSRFLPQAEDYKLLQTLVPGEYGNWWFEEVPWMIPSLRQAILSETVASRAPAGAKISRSELWESARRVRDKLSRGKQSPVVALRLEHLRKLHKLAQDKDAGKLFAEMIKELEALGEQLEAADIHLLAVLHHSLGDKEAARTYHRALRQYEQEQKTPAKAKNEALQALCCADLGYYELNVAGDCARAAENFGKARLVLGELAPPPFQVFVLCREADAWQQRGDWTAANDRLTVALHIAQKRDPQHALTAHAWSRRGWAWLDQWHLEQAKEAFVAADRVLASKRDPEARIARLDIRRGQALVKRYLGDLDGAVGDLRKLSLDLSEEFSQLREEAGAGSALVEIQARLVDRWVGTLEELADCNLFSDPLRRDLKEASDDLRRALRACFRISGNSGTRTKARLMFKQALVLSLPHSSIQDLDLARAYCKQAAELAASLPPEDARRIEFGTRLTPAIVALFQTSGEGKTEAGKDKRGRLEELRGVLESLRHAWLGRRLREHLELLAFGGKVLVEECTEADRYETLQDTETLLSLCRVMLHGKGEETRTWLRPYYDAVMATKLRLQPRHVKELLEVQWEATRGRTYQKDASAAPVLALYVLGEKCYLFFDVPCGPSKSYCLAEDYPLADIRTATREERLTLPRDVIKELKRLAEMGQPNVRCWWRDPLLEPEPFPGTGVPGGTLVQSSGFRGVAGLHFPFKLPDRLAELTDPDGPHAQERLDAEAVGHPATRPRPDNPPRSPMRP
jgi:hypothetical protein